MKYTLKAILILAIVLAATVAVKAQTEYDFNTIHIGLLGLFMFITSLLVHHFTLKASAENPKRFPAYFMAITGLKMMAYIVLIGIYVFLFQDNTIPVVIVFLTLYMAFTALEVFSAISKLKNPN